MSDLPNGWKWINRGAAGPHGLLFRAEREVGGKVHRADRWAAFDHHMATAEKDVVNVVLVHEQANEIARLRAPIKAQEWGDNYRDLSACPWCQESRETGGVSPNRTHRDDCPAFTPQGEVR